MFENRLLMNIFRPKKDEVTEDCIARSFMICTFHRMSLWLG